MANRLAASTSPYLLQHQDNPVDWWEWGDEAFAQARSRAVPVLVSIGYAACHWCHVMAHESFEDPATAAELNEHFVCVKVDREERPDVDAVYLAAVQALTGQGGWPATVFVTPEGKPFFAGTYFPPVPHGGLPSFRQVLAAVREAWQDRRGEVEDAGSRVSEALARHRVVPAPAPGSGPPGPQRTAEAVRALARDEDRQHGGFGGAPKFPPSLVLEFLLRHAAGQRLAVPPPVVGEPAESGNAEPGDTDATGESGTGTGTGDTDAAGESGTGIGIGESGTGELALAIAGRSLRAMAYSGMYDQLAGGFARYAVDRGWVVPHFEKMLYDNALLARVYLHWWRLTGDPLGARIAEQTCDWMLSALGTPQGGLASSLDADTPVADEHGVTHGIEGFTYVWTPGQLVEVLGAEEGAWAAELLQVTPAGSFEHGRSTLRLARDPEANRAEAERWAAARAKLLAARDHRPQPARDDKVVAAWNGLAVSALAETGALLGRPDLIHAAVGVSELLRSHVSTDGRLHRVSRDGVVGAPAGILEDYANVAEGLLTLSAVTGDPALVTRAGRLLDTVLDQFGDGSGGFHDTAADAEDARLAVVTRPADPADGPTPAGASAAAGALLGYAALTGSQRHRDAAEAALAVVDAGSQFAPRAFGWGLAVAEAWQDGPREVAVVGRPDDPLRTQLHRIALAGTAPGAVIAAGEPDTPGIPLLAGRPLRDGSAAAYVCRHFVCARPTSDADRLAAELGGRADVLGYAQGERSANHLV